MKKHTDRLVSFIFGLAIMVLVITFSIGLPIYVRPFYYAHIDALDMPDQTGFVKEDIIEAYDEVLDFLTLPGREFGTGKLLHSAEGKGHFEDCKVLFDLNRNAFLIALAVFVVVLILKRYGIVNLTRPCGFDIFFWSGASTLGIFAAIGIIAAQDFSRAFTVFHKIFFPGKDNWLFNPWTDEIILVMPEQFFMNCAILICASIILISLALITVGIILKKKRNNQT